MNVVIDLQNQICVNQLFIHSHILLLLFLTMNNRGLNFLLKLKI
jgi:hypothetical protein